MPEKRPPLLVIFSRIGLWASVTLLVLLSVLAAQIVFFILAMVTGVPYTGTSILITTLIPVFVASPFIYVFLRLLLTLDQTRQDLETLSQIDALTGICNRRHFLELGDLEVTKARRYRLPLSVLVLDLDHFKRINDSFGHHAGDIVLAEIVNLCRDELRDTDIMGRIGGEEFAVLLPMTPEKNAAVVADKLCRVIASHVITTRRERMHMTASIGVAALGDTDSLMTMLKAADRNLYVARSSGRNRVAS